jgi:hypothetical protein
MLTTGRGHLRSAVLALGFSVAFLVLFVAPPFLPYRFGPYPLVNWADVVDLLTPLVLIPLYWLLLVDTDVPMTPAWIIIFLILGAAWVDAHGIHLAANATGHLMKQQGPARDLTEFWDEKFGHFYWHGAAISLSALILYRHATGPVLTRRTPAGLAAAAIYGFSLFLIGVEGGTALLIVPFAVVVTLACWPLRQRLVTSPVVATFAIGNAVALVLFAIWLVYWGGRLPQFSELGWIK